MAGSCHWDNINFWMSICEFLWVPIQWTTFNIWGLKIELFGYNLSHDSIFKRKEPSPTEIFGIRESAESDTCQKLVTQSRSEKSSKVFEFDVQMIPALSKHVFELILMFSLSKNFPINSNPSFPHHCTCKNTDYVFQWKPKQGEQ